MTLFRYVLAFYIPASFIFDVIFGTSKYPVATLDVCFIVLIYIYVSPYIYQYKATNAANGLYYGYCLSATLEASTPTDNSCVPDTGQNYGVKNP